MIRNCIWAAVVLCGAYTLPAHGEIAGHVRVVDGDTLEVASTRVRLFGIDVPETKQTCMRGGVVWECGVAAKAYLLSLIGDSSITCEPRDIDRYGRTVAVCTVNGVSVNSAMVLAGMARAYVKYSTDYVADENAARTKRVGLWESSFEDPWLWRQDTAAKVEAQSLVGTAAPDNCLIKGNIGSGGKHIYHLPGTRDYEKTKINLERGERWFCTEAEALAAGWRKAASP